jgi:deoxycytidylate deaminase
VGIAGGAFVIGLTGPLGGGCTTAAKLICTTDEDFISVKLSQPIHDRWKEFHGDEPAAPGALQELGNEIRQEAQSSGILARLGLARLDSDKIDHSKIVIDGIRNVGEIEYLRDRYGRRFYLFSIECKKSQRWLRLAADYLKRGLSDVDFDAIDKRDKDEEVWYGQQVQLCVDRSDVLVTNEGTEGALLDKLIAHVRLVTGEIPRYATPSEILMNLAYSASHGSKCLKRQVGAVLVAAPPNQMGPVVGTGFNENPPQTKACVEEVAYGADPSKGSRGRCYRDILRFESFDKFAKEGVRCPKCGTPMASPQKDPPWRCHSCGVHLEDFFWPERAMSWCTAVHAEVAAILAAGIRSQGTTLYATTFPCFQCAEKIAQAGVTDVVFTESYPDVKAGYRLEIARIGVTRFEGVRSSRFDEIFSKVRPYFENPTSAPSGSQAVSLGELGTPLTGGGTAQ